MNEPPCARIRVGLIILTTTKYFQDVHKQNILLFIDNIFHFIQARFKYLPYCVQCPPLWVINLPLVPKWVGYFFLQNYAQFYM